MAITISELSEASEVIQDMQVTSDSITFTAVCKVAEQELGGRVRRTAGSFQCKAPVVAGRVFLSRVEVLAGGDDIPQSMMPERLEETIRTLLKALKWKSQYEAKAQQAPRNTETLLDSTVRQFIAENPKATAFEFGGVAATAFHQYTQTHARKH